MESRPAAATSGREGQTSRRRPPVFGHQDTNKTMIQFLGLTVNSLTTDGRRLAALAACAGV